MTVNEIQHGNGHKWNAIYDAITRAGYGTGANKSGARFMPILKRWANDRWILD